MTKRKKLVHLRKDALKRMLRYHKDKEIPSVELSNGAIIQTKDYSLDKFFLPCDNLHYKDDINTQEQLPCWDWFRMTNPKKNKMYYVTFGFPYIYLNENDIISFEFACKKYPLTTKEFIPEKRYFIMNSKNKAYDKMRDDYQEYILKNYDFSRTIAEAKEEIEKRKKNDKLIVTVSRDVDSGRVDGFNIVAPYNYKTKSIVDIFEEAQEKITTGRLDAEKIGEDLISEIKYNFYEEDLK